MEKSHQKIEERLSAFAFAGVVICVVKYDVHEDKLGPQEKVGGTLVKQLQKLSFVGVQKEKDERVCLPYHCSRRFLLFHEKSKKNFRDF